MKDLPLLNAIKHLPVAYDRKAALQAEADWNRQAKRKPSAGLAKLLHALAGNSPYLADLLNREHAFFADSLDRSLSDSIAAIYAPLTKLVAGQDTDALMLALRIAKRQLALLAATADIGGIWPVAEVTAALSAFAGRAVSLAAAHLLAEGAARGEIDLADANDPERGSGLVLLGMGKLGALELNYSSDIDVIVFYDEEVVQYRGRRTAQDFFVKLAQGLVRILSERNEDGYVFRTDLRLRPDPGSTPLALSLAAAETYYESFGQNWERAAMIKARAIAGDIEAGEAFLKRLSPFIWRRNLDFAAIEDIQSIKRQIHAHKGHGEVKLVGHNIKLGRGGIREIEFFAQTQQLIAGGRDPRLRDKATCTAIRALTDTNRVTSEARDDLIGAYEFLRRLEHRLQMVRDEQTHSIPAQADEIARIACFLGYADAGAFEAATLRVLAMVKRRYDELFAEAAPLGSSGNLVFTGTEDDPETLKTLSGYGFSDPATVAATIRGWHHGRYRAMRSERAREMLTKLMPRLLEAMAGAASPDAAFARFDEFLGRLPAGIQVFSLFHANPAILDVVAEVLGTAPRLAEHLGRNPQLFDALINDDFFKSDFSADALAAELDRMLATAADYQDVLDLCRRWVNDCRVRIGVLLLRNAMDAESVGHTLALVAETAMARLFPAVADEHIKAHGSFAGTPDKHAALQSMAIVALGKLGSREMTLESDLDLIFIYEHDRNRNTSAAAESSDGPRPLPLQPYYARLAQRFITALTALTAEGRLFEVDMRLRPSGNAGPIATDISAFSDYQRNAAWTWEHMALTRARVVYGARPLAAKIEAVIRDVLTRLRTDADTVTDVAAMRQRIAQAHPAKSGWQIKYARGGIVDIEFIAQYMQLRHGAKHPGILVGNTLEVLRKLAEAGCMETGMSQSLIEAGRLQANLSGIIRLAMVDDFDPASASKGLLAVLARAAGLQDFKTLDKKLAKAQSNAALAFEVLIGAPAAPYLAARTALDTKVADDANKAATKAKRKIPISTTLKTAEESMAAKKSNELKVGDAAPAFEMPADGGSKVSLKGLKGKKVVLYFYPKDNTSGCTKEAIDFSAAAKAFTKAGTVVIGCSRDSVKSHDGFKKKYKLAFPLGADEEGEVCEAYGVWVEKSMYGRKYMGIERATYLIDAKGRIAGIWRKVKVPGHADEVLAAAKAL